MPPDGNVLYREVTALPGTYRMAIDRRFIRMSGPAPPPPKHLKADYVAGAGTIIDGENELPLNAGDVVFIAPNDVHQFRNTGSDPLRFLCLIPNKATGKNVTVVPECGLES